MKYKLEWYVLVNGLYEKASKIIDYQPQSRDELIIELGKNVELSSVRISEMLEE